MQKLRLSMTFYNKISKIHHIHRRCDEKPTLVASSMAIQLPTWRVSMKFGRGNSWGILPPLKPIDLEQWSVFISNHLEFRVPQNFDSSRFSTLKLKLPFFLKYHMVVYPWNLANHFCNKQCRLIFASLWIKCTHQLQASDFCLRPKHRWKHEWMGKNQWSEAYDLEGHLENSHSFWRTEQLKQGIQQGLMHV